MEEAVWRAIIEILQNTEVQQKVLAKASAVYEKNTANIETERTKKRIEVLTTQLQALAERLGQIPTNVPAEPIYEQMAKLEAQRKEHACALTSLEAEGKQDQERVVHLQTYRAFLEALKALSKRTYTETPGVCRSIVQKLIHKIEVVPSGFTIHYFVGQEHVQKRIELEQTRDEAGDAVEKKKLVAGSTRLTNGGPDGDRTRVSFK